MAPLVVASILTIPPGTSSLVQTLLTDFMPLASVVLSVHLALNVPAATVTLSSVVLALALAASICFCVSASTGGAGSIAFLISVFCAGMSIFCPPASMLVTASITTLSGVTSRSVDLVSILDVCPAASEFMVMVVEVPGLNFDHCVYPGLSSARTAAQTNMTKQTDTNIAI